MGRKSRVKTQKSGTGATAVVSPKEMMNLISDLLQKCSSAAPSPGKEWEEYIQIRGLVEKIRKKQKGISVIFEGSREEFFPELMAWAQESGASCEGVEIANFAGEGFGLRATKDIKAEELFLWIPRTMLMTVESAKNSVLGPLYSQDRILQAMGNVTLALHLLCERADPSSPWLPYIKTLPGDYDTPLYYEEEEVHHLLSTQAIQDVLSQYKNTARQYAYFYKVIQTHLTTSKLPLKDAFTFDDYRWAVSSVMTRQNQIPTEDGSRVTLALIPLWDMCNHTNGLITTGYNLEDDRCECVALQDYKENEQIYIFYGTRSNAEFVIHNGFFFQENAHDRVKIKLGVSKSERLYAMKAEVLARAGIPSSSIFALHCSDPPISAQLLAFLRVFCMTEGKTALIFALACCVPPVSRRRPRDLNIERALMCRRRGLSKYRRGECRMGKERKPAGAARRYQKRDKWRIKNTINRQAKRARINFPIAPGQYDNGNHTRGHRHPRPATRKERCRDPCLSLRLSTPSFPPRLGNRQLRGKMRKDSP
ncbi:actin-histidine N-methyltransferase-like [Salvelinus namaycush]|uniref:protein-histidine N-methyltransferase n=1 Tax=Salvelinus namaycush TaxID=8040 RepID=A0A8U0PEK3_SALNM|nr:actin-histidine N-methyltransferase-like [Salvelinus namaycush]